MVTRLIPFGTHHHLKKLIWESTKEDWFPVAYRMNTQRQLARIFNAAGFRECDFAKVDDYRAPGGFPGLRFFELSCRTLLRRCGLRYPESCLLAVYERCRSPGRRRHGDIHPRFVQMNTAAR